MQEDGDAESTAQGTDHDDQAGTGTGPGPGTCTGSGTSPGADDTRTEVTGYDTATGTGAVLSA